MKGFKCGVEIHQRLDTGKLFCNCYANPSKEDAEAGFKFARRLRATAGELGAIDRAAVFQAALGKTYNYDAPLEESCLVECDDEPPHGLNAEAMEQALAVAKALKMTLVDEVQVMRKTVVDGSAVGGFQRTSLVAVGGSLADVGIQTLCLEEESSAITPEGYRLDRLGIPLLEIATAPEIRDGGHCREFCEALGLLLRSACRVQRGIGSIRQDVNISIEGGSRIEIKGVQDLKALPELVNNEVERQQALVKLKGTKIKASPVGDWSGLFAKSPCKILAGKKVYGFTADCPGLLKTQMHEGKTLGNELAGYARASGAKGVIHSDEELSKYCLQDFPKKGFWMVCAGNAKALEAVRARLLQVGEGVPEETRRADGGKTDYLRPLPGGARMYPETDVPPVALTAALVAGVKQGKSFEERVSGYEKMGLGRDLAVKVARSEKAALFESLAKAAEPKIVAAFLTEKMVELRRKGVAVDEIGENELRELFKLYKGGFLTKAGLEAALEAVVGVPPKEFKRALEEKGFKKLDAKQVKALARGFKGSFAEFMAENRLRVDPAEARRAFQKKAD